MKFRPPNETPLTIKRVGAIGFAILVVLLASFYWIVCESWSCTAVEQPFNTMQKVLPELNDQAVVEQQFSFPGDQLVKVIIYPNIPKATTGTLTAQVFQGETELTQGVIPIESLVNMEAATIYLNEVVLPRDTSLTLRLTVARPDEGTYFSLFYGTTVDIGRYQIASNNVDGLMVNGQALTGHLDIVLSGLNHSRIMSAYLYIALGILLIYVAWVAWICWCQKHGKRNIFLIAIDEVKRYSFLLERLVSRDFNTKYRQSMLGVFWSFLNPLLTMAVYYLVFSTLFKNNIQDFVVYLLSGIVIFNFFSESSSMGLESITSNASLINKVYVPKYIYPFSRVVSSLVNLLISLVPLLTMVFITGLPITKAFLLLPIPILLLAIFSLGMSLLLSTSNVFFRDTKFLWSVVIMLWNFLTPIFYPESIIPSSLIKLYHMNPLYQFIYFVRCILMNGVTPQPITYLYCTLCAVVPFLLGLWAFRTHQNKFVLYL